MLVKICAIVVMVSAITCLGAAWPTQSEWHDLEFARDTHSRALTAIGVGLMFAFVAITKLSREVSSLRAREAAAQLDDAAGDAAHRS